MQSSVGLVYALHRPRVRRAVEVGVAGGGLGRLGRPIPTPPALHRTLPRLRPVISTRPWRARTALPPTLQIPSLSACRAAVAAAGPRPLCVRRVPRALRAGRRILLPCQFRRLGPADALVCRPVQIRAGDAFRLQLSSRYGRSRSPLS